MFQWLFIVALAAVALAEPLPEPAPEPATIVVAEPADPVADPTAQYASYHNHRDERHHEKVEDGEHNGPTEVRLIDPSKIMQGPHISKYNKVILNTYSPDYYQPTWILDYRYQKTGGRDYTRADGGQILILPKNVHTHDQKDYNNFDELLEFLRLKQLAESEAYKLHPKKYPQPPQSPDLYVYKDEGRHEKSNPHERESYERKEHRRPENSYGWLKEH